MRPVVALDLFAGTGWGVACQALGIAEHGVELMPEAIASREAAGMSTIYHDVWDGLRGAHEVPDYSLLIASPPCQTFSAAGSGKGRQALDQVLAAIDAGDYRDVELLHALGEATDPRTALVLTPLAHVYRDLPEYVLFEQVPPVLPVWERCAEVMRELGYSAWTGVVNAEQYGVPQTRKRAILMASLWREVSPPAPTHSRYYPRDPSRLDEGVLPWVSMADALGWGRTARPSVTVTGGGTETGGAEPLGHLDREVAAADWVMRSNYGTGGDPENRGERALEQPAATVTSKVNRNHWTHNRPSTTVVGSFQPDVIAAPGYRTVGGPSRQNAPGSVRVSAAEAAALQSYPDGFTFAGAKGKQFLQIGNAVPPLLARHLIEAVVR